MKNIVIGLIAVAFGATLNMADLQGTQTKSKESKQQAEAKGEHFDMRGTVKKMEIDICMVTGLRYWLHPKRGEDVRLKPMSKHDSQILDDAPRTTRQFVFGARGTRRLNVVTCRSQRLRKSSNARAEYNTSKPDELSPG